MYGNFFNSSPWKKGIIGCVRGQMVSEREEGEQFNCVKVTPPHPLWYLILKVLKSQNKWPPHHVAAQAAKGMILGL